MGTTPKIICFPSYDEMKLMNKMIWCAERYIAGKNNEKTEEYQSLVRMVDEISCSTIDEILDLRKEWKSNSVCSGRRNDELVDAVTSIAFARRLCLHS